MTALILIAISCNLTEATCGERVKMGVKIPVPCLFALFCTQTEQLIRCITCMYSTGNTCFSGEDVNISI